MTSTKTQVSLREENPLRLRVSSNRCNDYATKLASLQFPYEIAHSFLFGVELLPPTQGLVACFFFYFSTVATMRLLGAVFSTVWPIGRFCTHPPRPRLL